MNTPIHDRRTFLRVAALTAGISWASTAAQPAEAAEQDEISRMDAWPISCNQQGWLTYCGREGREFHQDCNASLAELAQSGLAGFEPLVESPDQIVRLAPLLRTNRLQMHSIYLNAPLHQPTGLDAALEQVLAIAEKARRLCDTRLVVVNPAPIRWGGPESKSDAQLQLQAQSLGHLGRELREHGQTLAYHCHEAELAFGGREFHHMLQATDPQHVTLCFDVHGLFRGVGNSSLGLFDLLHQYGKRISTVHLRQSQSGVWSETLGPGDIDLATVLSYLRQLETPPHLVLEQAVEPLTPHSLDVIAAHRRSREYLESLL